MYGEKLRLLRGRKSKEEVSKDLGISVSALTKYEREERMPRDEYKVKLAAYYGKTVQFIFFEDAVHSS